jgi:hypothetical protein
MLRIYVEQKPAGIMQTRRRGASPQRPPGGFDGAFLEGPAFADSIFSVTRTRTACAKTVETRSAESMAIYLADVMHSFQTS